MMLECERVPGGESVAVPESLSVDAVVVGLYCSSQQQDGPS